MTASGGGDDALPVVHARATAEAFRADLRRAGARDSADLDEVVTGVVDAYADPRRRYHDLRHLAEVREALHSVSAPHPADDAAVLAAWFHDVVHGSSRDASPAPSLAPSLEVSELDAVAGDDASDEALSAEVARRDLTRLGLDPRLVDLVADLVDATATHRVPDGLADDTRGVRAAQALLDADLWILSAPADRFDAYCAQVRAEYAFVDDATYAAARTDILRDLARRPRLYLTAEAQATWTGPARANLARELDRLRA